MGMPVKLLFQKETGYHSVRYYYAITERHGCCQGNS